MAIYSRDNLQLQGAIDAALRNRQAHLDRDEGRRRSSMAGIADAAKAFGRWYELDKADLDKKLEQLEAEKEEAEEYSRAYNERMKAEYGTIEEKKARMAAQKQLDLESRAAEDRARRAMLGYTPAQPQMEGYGAYMDAMHSGRPDLRALEEEYRRIPAQSYVEPVVEEEPKKKLNYLQGMQGQGGYLSGMHGLGGYLEGMR